jgi:hypothetical protein
LKEDKRIIAERRGESEMRFVKWQVGCRSIWVEREQGLTKLPQNGKPGEARDLNAANEAAAAEKA